MGIGHCFLERRPVGGEECVHIVHHRLDAFFGCRQHPFLRFRHRESGVLQKAPCGGKLLADQAGVVTKPLYVFPRVDAQHQFIDFGFYGIGLLF